MMTRVVSVKRNQKITMWEYFLELSPCQMQNTKKNTLHIHCTWKGRSFFLTSVIICFQLEQKFKNQLLRSDQQEDIFQVLKDLTKMALVLQDLRKVKGRWRRKRK